MSYVLVVAMHNIMWLSQGNWLLVLWTILCYQTTIFRTRSIGSIGMHACELGYFLVTPCPLYLESCTSSPALHPEMETARLL